MTLNRKAWIKIVFLGILTASALILGGCVRPTGPSPAPTQTDSPTSQPLASPSPTPSPSASPQGNLASPEPPDSPSETPPPPPPSETPTPFPITLSPPPSPTPEEGLPIAPIEINRPGPLSKVITPFRVSAFLEPGYRGRIRVELLGEDGRLLVRKVLFFSADPDKKILLITDMEFEIAAVAETGRLVISVEDGWGRVTNLASVDLILLNEGDYDLNPAGDQLAPLIILEPGAGDNVSGGEVIVSGLARPQGDRPLELELLNRQGGLVGSRQAAVAEGPADQHRPFAAAIPFQVDQPTWVLLVVRERSDRIPGTTQLVSQEILLSPE